MLLRNAENNEKETKFDRRVNKENAKKNKINDNNNKIK